jgi:hypothetical protein
MYGEMYGFDAKKAISVLGIALYCVSYVTNVEESPLTDAFKSIHSLCLITLYVFGVSYYYLSGPHKLQFGHRVYILLCLFGLASSLWSDYASQVLSNTAHAIGLFFVCVVICDALGRNYQRFLWTVLIAVSAVSALSIAVVIVWPDIGIVNDTSYAGTHSEFSLNGRWSGITDHPNQLGSYASIGSLIAAYLLVDYKKNASRSATLLTLAACAAMNVVALIGSDSKTSLTSTTFALLTYIFIYKVLGCFKPEVLKDFPKNFNTGVLAVAAVFVFAKTFEVDKLLFEAMGRDANISGRAALWDLGWEAISERPLSGWSFDSFSTLRDTHGAMTYYQFHNSVIDLLAKGGIIGFILGALTYLNFTSMLGRADVEADAVKFATVFLLYFMISSYSESNLYRPESLIWFIWVICWFCLLREAEKPQPVAVLLLTHETRGVSI